MIKYLILYDIMFQKGIFMIAKIKTNSGVYNSIILGFWGKGWKTKAIVMSEDNSTLKIIKYWNPKRCIFVIDGNRDGWMKKGDFAGYDWVYKNISKKFFNIRINSREIIDKCKEMQSQINVDEWHLIKDIKDINNLGAASINFHDASVESILKDNDKIIINFSAWDCNIVLELTGGTESNLYVGCGNGNSFTDDGYWDGITESKMFFEDGYIYWVNSGIIKNSKEIFAVDFNRYCKAQSVRWKIII